MVCLEAGILGRASLLLQMITLSPSDDNYSFLHSWIETPYVVQDRPDFPSSRYTSTYESDCLLLSPCNSFPGTAL